MPINPLDDGDTPVALTKADIDRVDGVSGPANGVPFLVMKALEDHPEAADVIKAAMEVDEDDTPHATAAMATEPGALTNDIPAGVEAPDLPPPAPEAPVEAPVVAEAPEPTVPDAPAADAAPAPEEPVAALPEAPAVDAVPDPAVEVEPVAKSLESDVADALAAPLPDVPVVAAAGDPAWEAEDAANAKAAVALLLALRERVNVAAAREGAEGDWSAEWNLEDAGNALDFVLSILAVHAVNESAEAGETVLKALEAVMPETPAIEDAPVDVAKATDPQTPATPEGDVTDVIKAITGDPAFTDVLKSIVAEAVSTEVAKGVAPLAEDLAAAVERVAKMEKQPMPGGPLMNGAATTRDGMFYVSKSGPLDASVDGSGGADVVAKAIEAITDRGARDVAGREVAAAMHPLARQQ